MGVIWDRIFGQEVVMSKRLLMVSTLLIVPFAAWSWQGQTSPKTPSAEYKIPPEAASKANPVKPTPESLARGKKIYGYDCEVCHGKDGDGKGDMTEMKGIPDFTDPATLKDRTDGELFYITQKGKGEMPPEGDRAKTEDLWNLVNYVRSFKKKQ
jgi:mono/diheme cytochrome c family protein